MGAHTTYQDISVLAGLLLPLLAGSERYQPPHYEGVEDCAHLVIGHLHSLLQEPLVDEGTLQRASHAFFPLLADELAYLLGQYFRAPPSPLLATEHKINRKELLVQTLDAKEACEDARTSEKSISTRQLGE